MFEKILVPTDFSAYSRKVMECVCDIPGVKEIVLLNVVSRPALARVWNPVAEINEAEKKLATEKDAVEMPNINIKTKAISAVEEDIAGLIQKVAEEEKASLVVMGARGKSLINSTLLGSVSRNTLRFGDKHLLIMRYEVLGSPEGLVSAGAKGIEGIRERDASERLEKFCVDIFSKVLIPTDFTQPDEAAISFIKSIPGVKELVLLHVISRGETQAEIDASISKAIEQLKSMSEELGKGGLKVTTRVVIGNPVDEIRNIASELNASLIAMSSVGKDTLKTGRIGSRTYDVANSAERPVLVVRMQPVFSTPSV